MSTKLPVIRIPNLRPVLKPTVSQVVSPAPSKITVIPRIASKTLGVPLLVPRKRNISVILPEFLNSADKLGYAAKLPVEELAELVTALSDAYYNADPLVEDRLFDDIQEVLKLIDPNNKALKKIGSEVHGSSEPEFESFNVDKYPQITNRGRSFTNPNYRVKVQLPFLMPSMDKVKPADLSSYGSWLGKTHPPYNISDKLDGMSVALVYVVDPNNKITVRLLSRGDGMIGEDLSAIIPYLRLPPIPDGFIRGTKEKHLFLRGEVLISKDTFKRELGTGTMAMRNIARGIMARKTLQTAFLELLDLVIYELVSPWNTRSFTEGLNQVKSMGFNVVPNRLIPQAPNLEELRQLLIQRKEDSKYELDGLIITQDQINVRDIKAGDKFPSYAIAFKFDSDSDDIESALTIVKFVTWNKSKDGKLTPVATIRPVGLGGTKVEHVTVHNASHVIAMGIGPGAIIRVTRGGDVIPHIVASLRPVAPQMPDFPFEWNETGKSIYIPNADDDEQVFMARIENFFKRMDVPSWGPATVQKIMVHNWPALGEMLAEASATPTSPATATTSGTMSQENTTTSKLGAAPSIHEILDMTVEDFMKIPGYQGKMASKLYDSLREKLANVNIVQLMAASNIFGAGWGERRFQTIMEAIPDLLEEKFETPEDRARLLQKIISVQGFQKTTATPLVEGLAPFIAWLYGIYRLGWVGIYRQMPLPEPYILATDEDRTDPELDSIWDSLQSMGYSMKDYTDTELREASELQTHMFDQIHNDLDIFYHEKEMEEAKKKAAQDEIKKQADEKIKKLLEESRKLTVAQAQMPQASVPVSKQRSILPVITVPAAKPAVVKPSLLGLRIVFTGVHKGFEDQVERLGGKIGSAVSGNTDILVVKDASFSSSKVAKAQTLGKKIMTVDEFSKTYLS